MMNNVLEYKGYHTKLEVDIESHSVRGKIEGINDFVDFETDDLAKVEEEFHSAVDDYLNFCVEVGKTPEKEYKGVFNVRIAPELHKAISQVAYKKGISLNAAVEEAISSFTSKENQLGETIKSSIDDLTETIKLERSVAISSITNSDTKRNTFISPSRCKFTTRTVKN